MEKRSIYSIKKPFETSSSPTGGGVIVDLGTGDGRFVYQSARSNPDRFYIGIDASATGLEKISERIHRKPSKGGLSNVLFLQAAVEELPRELDGIANEVHIHFPWGSLLRAVALGDAFALAGVRRICGPDALVEVVIGIDPDRDRTEMDRLGLGALTLDYVAKTLVPKYESAGFEVIESGAIPPSDWPMLQTSWAKRLKQSATRPLLYIIARRVPLK